MQLEVLAPLPLQQGPEPLNGVQRARVGGQEHDLEVVRVDLVQLLRVVDLQVIQNEQYPLAGALLLETDEKVFKMIGVVALIDN